MLSDAPFWRLVWKEYRTHRPLWLAILIGTPVLQLALVLGTWMQTSQTMHPSMTEEMLRLSSSGLVNIAYVSVVVYLIGCVGTMFSIDHETGVFPFIRVLPTTQPRVFWSKIGFAVVSWAALALLIGLITAVAFVSKVPEDANWHWTYGVLFLVEVFAWSLFSSLWIRQPLWAIVVALAGQALVYSLAFGVLLERTTRGIGWTPMYEDRWLTVFRLATTLALLAGGVFCGRLWFEERLRLPRWSWRRENALIDSYDLAIVPMEPRVRVRRPAASITDDPPFMAERRASRTRLLWQSWRDARFLIIGLAVWLGRMIVTGEIWDHLSLLYVTLPVSFVCGILSFGLDQQGGRLRYFAERGCVPREVWLSRQLVWLSPVVLITLYSFSVALRFTLRLNWAPTQMAAGWTLMTLGPLLCYGFGQLAAMMIRSIVVAAAVGLALSVGGLMWLAWMSSWLSPAWWTVGGVPAITLFVTWLKSNDWIEERRDRVARWRTRLGVAVPSAMLLIAIAAYRVVQIPVATLPAEWDAPRLTASQLSPTDRETLDLYRRVLHAMETKTREHYVIYKQRVEQLRVEHPDWIEQELIRVAHTETYAGWSERLAEVGSLLKQAHSRPAVPLTILEDELPLPTPDNPDAANVSSLNQNTLDVLAQASTAKGELDEAWREIEVRLELADRSLLQTSRRYGHRFYSGGEPFTIIAEWGRHPLQTRERIVAAIRKLETRESTALQIGLMSIQAELTGSRILLRLDPRWRDIPREVLDQGYAQLQYPPPEPIPASRWTAWQWMFSEHWRSERFLRWEAAMAVASLRSIAADIEFGRVPQRPQRLRHQQPPTSFDYSQSGRSIPVYGPINWSESRHQWDSNVSALLRSTVLPPTVQHGLATFVERQLFAHVESLRATQLQLALADWYREHGSYPETLAELVPTYFDKLPLEPMRATPFGYFPKGLPQDVSYEQQGTPAGKPSVQTIVAKDIPFLWTSPPHLVYTPQRQPDGEWLFNNSGGQSNSIEVALRQCRVWQLPVTRAAER